MDDKEKRQHERVENRTIAGICIAALAALSTPFWGPLVSPDNKQEPPAQAAPGEQQATPGMMYLPLQLGEGKNLELALSPDGNRGSFTFVSATLTLDEKARADWAKYAPVRLIIPELSHVQPFAVEHGERVLFSHLNHIVNSRQTVYYLIAGRDPATGKAYEVAKHALNFGGRQKQ